MRAGQNSNSNKMEEKVPKLTAVENPYFIKEEREEVIERRENDAELAELQAKLEHYQRLSTLSSSIKIWVVIMNVIVIPVFIGVTIAFFAGTSKNKPSLQDFAAAVSSKTKSISDK